MCGKLLTEYHRLRITMLCIPKSEGVEPINLKTQCTALFPFFIEKVEVNRISAIETLDQNIDWTQN